MSSLPKEPKHWRMISVDEKVGITPSFDRNTKALLWMQTLVGGCWSGTDSSLQNRTAEHYVRSSEAAGLSGAWRPLPSFVITLQAFHGAYKKVGQSCSPCPWGSPAFSFAEVFPCTRLLQKISLLQCPPISDITDFSHLTCEYLGFSAPTFFTHYMMYVYKRL